MNLAALLAGPPLQLTDAYWRSMRYFNLYRFIIACLLVSAHFIAREADWWQLYATPPYLRVAVAYVLFALGMAALTEVRRPLFERPVTLQAVGDISFILMLQLILVQ